ncbi:Protein SQS1 [Trichoderma lentiforme]|uniref:Protein SQS1 n=1 Tax=Trichoderma lentiforme TaxID=1567552 RepID=A0A9P4X5Y6_9HYPO|nr:Protein SQS1 [Trichoderma lentiforme]
MRGGRGRGRGGKQRSGWNQSPRQRGNFANYDVATPAQNVAFTLLDEARQSSHHDNSFWSSNTQLRKRPVTFVSSGTHDPLLDLQRETETAKDGPQSTATPEDSIVKETPPQQEAPVEAISETIDEEPSPVQTTHVEASTEEIIPEEITTEKTMPEEATSEEITPEEPIFDGTAPEEPILKEMIPTEIAPEQTVPEETAPEEAMVPHKATEEINVEPASQDDTSSDEVIVFKGRNAMKPKEQAPSITLTSMTTEIRAVEKQISVAVRGPQLRTTLEDDDSDDLLWPTKKRGKARSRRNREKDEEDAWIADYIANMRENGEMFEGMGIDDDSDSGSTDDDAEVPPSAPSGPENAKEVEVDSESDEIPDLEDIPDLDDLEEQAGFDFMDWERPSLRRKKGKGRRLQLLGDDIDSDLEEQLQSAFNNDRLKKAQRKKEREELRAMGLLGKKGQVDLRAKYSTGITMGQVAEEVKTFLLGSQETHVYHSTFKVLNLPPMDKRTRKMVHDLANKFDIKSKSIGAGEQRRPVLYRTKKTTYREAAFEQAVTRIKRQYSRPSQPSKQSRQKPSGRNDAGTSYRDGEVIGASAPELGSGNRGRNMLEKMGWSTGTPLGASDNQGILHPVSQTMKRTRAGLGQG